MLPDDNPPKAGVPFVAGFAGSAGFAGVFAPNEKAPFDAGGGPPKLKSVLGGEKEGALCGALNPPKLCDCAEFAKGFETGAAAPKVNEEDVGGVGPDCC